MTACINEELYLDYPTGFHVMSTEELHDVYLDENPNRWGIWDKDRHMIVAVFWNRANALLAAVASAKDTAKSIEKTMRKEMKPLDYRSNGFFEREVCDLNAYGFRYGYVKEGTHQDAQAVVVKHGNVFYTVYYYGRKDMEGSEELFDRILDTMHFEMDL